MKRPIIRYDELSDSLFIATRAGSEEEFVEVIPGINVELDAKGRVLGIEILKASQVLRSVSNLSINTSITRRDKAGK